MLILFSYSGPSGLLGSDKKQDAELLQFPLVLMNRLNKTKFAVFIL